LLQSLDQPAFGAGAVALIEVGGAEVHVGAVMLEEVPDNHQD
jgi:hypothetical protein